MRPPIRKALLLSLKLKWSRHTTQVPHMRFLDLHTRWTCPNALATDSKASAVIAMCDIFQQGAGPSAREDDVVPLGDDERVARGIVLAAFSRQRIFDCCPQQVLSHRHLQTSRGRLI